MGYLYIELPVTAQKTLASKLFHIFPSTDQELFSVVLPEPDGRFSASFYIPKEKSFGGKSYPELKAASTLSQYLSKQFPLIKQSVPDFDDQVFRKCLRPITAVSCSTWYLKGQVCLLGDASHAIFPFYGAGLNTGLEDLNLLIQHIDKLDRWEDVFSAL